MRDRNLSVVASLAALLILAQASAVCAQVNGGYTIPWYTIDGGGLTGITGQQMRAGVTIGQADAGKMVGGNYTLEGGFWSAALVGCQQAVAPLSNPDIEDVGFGAMLRFTSILPTNAGLETAIRVTFDNLPFPFDTLNGQSMWVGPPKEICENSGQNELVPINECGPAIGLPIISGDPGPTLFIAFLQCDPFYMDWSTIPKPININSEFIVPSGTYSIQAVDQACSPANESSFSDPLIITNTQWGDLVGLSCLTSETCSAPDGVVGITSDVSAVLEMFKNTNFAPGKARSDVEPSILDFKINFTDVTLVLDAFSSEPYPHAPSTTNPCP